LWEQLRQAADGFKFAASRLSALGDDIGAATEEAAALIQSLSDRIDVQTSLLRQTLYALHTGRSEPLFIIRDAIRNHLEDSAALHREGRP
jgi:hypothetical protein